MHSRPPRHRRAAVHRPPTRMLRSKGAFRRALTVLAAAVVALAVPATAQAGDTGSTTTTVHTVVRSITVTPAAVTYGTCTGGSSTGDLLGFPNGRCSVTPGTIVITNGPTASHIEVVGTDATAADGGTGWQLCQCTPGNDQYAVQTIAASGTGTFTGPQLSTGYVCDTAYAAHNGTPGCAAAAGQASVGEGLALTGPARSTDNAGTFTARVTWIAAP